MPTGGGLLQLVAQGKQDIYLTGNPQMSFFKMVYRRHTNFATESMPMYFDGEPNWGQTINCLIPRRGDLLSKVYLRVTVPQLTQVGTNNLVSYCNSIGHALIEEVKIQIGEQDIDKQTGEWMEIWSQLTTPTGQLDAYDEMIGRLDNYMPPNLIPSQDGRILYIPLQFWFCRNPGLALPLLALQYNPIRIIIKLAPLQKMFWTGDLISDPCAPQVQVNPVKLTNCMLWGDFVYLDNEERRVFVKNSQEYLIEQVQYTNTIDAPPTQNIVTAPIEFNNPIKEFIFVVQRNVMQQYHEYFNYSSLAINELFDISANTPLANSLAPGQTRTDLISDAVLQLDGYNRFEARDPMYFRLLQPYEHHTNTPFNSYIYCYSFALQPENIQPSGSMNASRLNNILWQITMNNTLNASGGNFNRGTCGIRIYAINHNIFRTQDGFGGLLFKI